MKFIIITLSIILVLIGNNFSTGGRVKKKLSFQEMLNEGTSPFDLTNNNEVRLSDFYGLYYQGGLIFYLNKEERSGLVAATTEYQISWKGDNYLYTNATQKSIGSGLSNTKKIISIQGNKIEYSALKCDIHLEDGYDDWFLPSIDELNLMYKHLRVNGFGDFAAHSYWSSTEFNKERAWAKSFLVPNPDHKGNHIKKYHNAMVRPVRAFKF